MALAQELNAFIVGDENEEAKCSDVSSLVFLKRMMLCEKNKKRLENLQRLYGALKTIKPSSVETERVCSAN